MSPPPLDRRTLLQAIGLLGLSRQAWAATLDVHVLSSGDTPAQQALVQALSARLPSLHVQNDLSAPNAKMPTGASIVLGAQAVRQALDKGLKGPTIAVLTSAQAQRLGMASLPSRERPGWSALYTDASPLSQFQLIDAVFERKVNVGVLLSEASAHLERALGQAATTTGMNLLLAKVGPQDNVVRAINRIGDVQVLLAVADSQLYTPDSLRAVLESTYRRGLPVIGFSPATVSAGTLATACSDVGDVTADLIDWAESLRSATSVAPGEARHCRYWKIKVNDSVARSLGIPLSERLLKLGVQPLARSAR
ncbi:MAG TPA: hypothetical protein VFW84_07810 [Aquabacterium sp.]|uniref:hypothetical protein n=1 Tax=Aquabacterium sp. TaxID=1872578 RepID=UPI002DA3DC1E|nr:hypothetical protein [Aquabacterium sp.]HET6787408.1 hypothetical protein [Aquabacterium sp.]HEX5372624.1 hypothetical protein [Aquabacterium sp.]